MATVFPRASTLWDGGSAPTTDYSGTFIPAIWSGKMLEKFYASTVIGAIANTDYEGEIKNYGDTVHIRQHPDITVSTYETDMSLAVQRPSAATVDLQIDKGLYFNTVVDDVIEVQSDINLLSDWAQDAAEQMKISVDRAVLRTVAAGVAAANKGLTGGAISGDLDLGVTTDPVAVTTTNIVETIVNMGQTLDEQNIPETDRWIVIPAWMAALIKRSELRDASLTGDGQSMLRNGRLGMIERFTVYMSNLLPTGVADSLAAGEFNVFAGHPHGLTFASQFSKVETLRAESTFGTLFRGLQVYGSKVEDGDALVSSIVTKG